MMQSDKAWITARGSSWSQKCWVEFLVVSKHTTPKLIYNLVESSNKSCANNTGRFCLEYYCCRQSFCVDEKMSSYCPLKQTVIQNSCAIQYACLRGFSIMKDIVILKIWIHIYQVEQVCGEVQVKSIPFQREKLVRCPILSSLKAPSCDPIQIY